MVSRRVLKVIEWSSWYVNFRGCDDGWGAQCYDQGGLDNLLKGAATQCLQVSHP